MTTLLIALITLGLVVYGLHRNRPARSHRLAGSVSFDDRDTIRIGTEIQAIAGVSERGWVSPQADRGRILPSGWSPAAKGMPPMWHQR